jgi:hypothetical protein
MPADVVLEPPHDHEPAITIASKAIQSLLKRIDRCFPTLIMHKLPGECRTSAAVKKRGLRGIISTTYVPKKPHPKGILSDDFLIQDYSNFKSNLRTMRR